MSTKKPANEQTSARVASTAAKLLSNPRTPAAVKSVAASALTQKVSTMVDDNYLGRLTTTMLAG